MKTLVVRQPWAELLVTGIKRVELRTWTTNHRGPLAICAGRATAVSASGHAAIVRNKLDPTTFVRGAIIGIVMLDDCREPIEGDEALACTAIDDEHLAWVCSAACRINPIPIIGQLGLFDVDVPARQFNTRNASVLSAGGPT